MEALAPKDRVQRGSRNESSRESLSIVLLAHA